MNSEIEEKKTDVKVTEEKNGGIKISEETLHIIANVVLTAFSTAAMAFSISRGMRGKNRK